MTVPAQPKIYHITPVDKLPDILASGGMLSDAELIARGALNPAVGMPHIKQRRLTLTVACHPGTCVGHYVPFYFCPRSVMLYIISRGNHQDLTYQGEQDSMVHLEADLHEVVAWAEAHFLVHEFFPWECVRRIGEVSVPVKKQTEAAMAKVAHHPLVEVHRDWYY